MGTGWGRGREAGCGSNGADRVGVG